MRAKAGIAKAWPKADGNSEHMGSFEELALSHASFRAPAVVSFGLSLFTKR
jgi:hypothetical protein